MKSIKIWPAQTKKFDYNFVPKNVFFQISGLKRSPDSTKVYTELAQKLEHISKVSYIIFVKLLLPGIVLPPLCRTLFQYLYHDLKEEAFFLPCQLLYVKNYIFVTFIEMIL